jgi:DNA processing protein
VSGLAVGIDAAAHRGGLSSGGSSIAVVGTGLDLVYPARNRDLAQRLAREGGMVSEFALGTPPLPENFPRRNRLISGLARGVIVVEATLNSGSLITARLAAEQGREVFAIPGSIDSPFSKGTHRLIREGAKLVETAQDILEELGVAAEARATSTDGAQNEPAASSPGEGPAAKVLTALGHEPAGIDLLVRRTGLSAESITVALVELEVAGRLVGLPGGLYQRRD